MCNEKRTFQNRINILEIWKITPRAITRVSWDENVSLLECKKNTE